MDIQKLIEDAAIELWHRFSPQDHEDWTEEYHKAEYRLAAKEILSGAMIAAAGYDEDTLLRYAAEIKPPEPK